MTPLRWDSDFFGVEIARADPGEPVADEAASARAAGIDCLYVTVPGAAPAGIHAAVALGARLVDLRTELDRDGTAPAAPAAVRRAGADDLAGLEAGAAELSAVSRFTADPRFARDRVAEMYRVWVRRALDEGTVVVPAGGERAFVAALPGDGETRLALVWVAPRSAGRGLGRTLVDAALAETGAGRATVATQAGNAAALRLYEAAGFRTRSVDAVLHLWLDEAA